jgi:AraC family transcriptional regulator
MAAPTLPDVKASAGPSGWADYARALDRVTVAIEAHVEQPLDLARLAEVACLSAHHFHRVYHAMRGETLAATVQRIRLQRAAWWLANSQQPVEAIAQRCGYAGAASFIRRFRLAYGSTPAAYRRSGPHQMFRAAGATQAPVATPDLQVELRQLPAQQLVVVPHRGPYIRIGEAFERLLSHVARQGRSATTPRPAPCLVGVYLDDPATVSASTLRSMAGLQVADAAAWQPPLQAWRLPAGRCAVLRYRGPYASMHAAYRWLFGQWLPQSGQQPADHPLYEVYLNDPRQVAPADLLTDIHLPLRGPADQPPSTG